MKLSLVVLTPGPNEGKVLEIKLSQFVVGRDPQCHLRPASPMISKRHCAVLQREGKAFIRDFGSTNGTFVNDEPVKGELELHPGDHLKIGPLLFEVRIEASAPVNRPTPPPPTKPATQDGHPDNQSPTPVPAAKAKAPVEPAVADRAGGRGRRLLRRFLRRRHRGHAAVAARRRTQRPVGIPPRGARRQHRSRNDRCRRTSPPRWTRTTRKNPNPNRPAIPPMRPRTSWRST